MKNRFLIVSMALYGQAALADIPAASFNLIGKDSELCFQATETKKLIQKACSAESLFWRVTKNPDESYIFRTNVNEQEYCLTASGLHGEPVRLGDCQLAANWLISPLRDGFKMVERDSGFCNNIAGNRLLPDATLTQYGCTTGDNEKLDFKLAGPAVLGQWGEKIDLGLIPISAAVLPTGKVLYWSGSNRNGFHGKPITYTGLFDPENEAHTEETVMDSNLYEMFCPATVMDKDGSVIIIGGGAQIVQGSVGIGRREYVASYNFRDEAVGAWKREKDLNVPRWYNSAIMLGDGSIFTIGGAGDGQPIHSNMEKKGEIWDPETRSFRYLSQTRDVGYHKDKNGTYGKARGEYYRKLTLTHDGSILEYAPYKDFIRHTVEGEGSSTLTGNGRDGGPRFIQGAASAQYSSDKLLMIGGSAEFGEEDQKKEDQKVKIPALDSVYEIDLATGVSETKASMHHKRYYPNSVVLPDGKVLTIGGSRDNHLFNTVNAVLTPEMYDPQTDRWTEMADMSIPRNYHSTAVLLPDGRVWAGGGGACGNCEFNYPDAQIFSPPYLFKGERPEINLTLIENRIGYQQDFNLFSNQELNSMVLVRLSSITHSSNTDQRRIELDYEVTANNGYKLTTPSSIHIAPPGYYMLFGLNQNGVPSHARIVQLGSDL
ncbi:galactose oxidase-like domain-containing protein [Motiliproteus sp. MSK22-1]|uniref:galactose oxidase-like domain-containing protein n=1 Tax=Motiliproteus sp. MSK22-1 TaxID=1897630 RepID=UPI000978827D|nr:galactose oxidase-like domain-containing protein [Motiliproteus sp. MSK22-1]OMH25567.1 galactose oxidase [Motiliproteus sp. MSK22-1]